MRLLADSMIAAQIQSEDDDRLVRLMVNLYLTNYGQKKSPGIRHGVLRPADFSGRRMNDSVVENSRTTSERE
jgi:hypothetical protein